MTNSSWSQFWSKAGKCLLNKYVIVLSVAAVVFLFVGEQSLVNRVRRASEISRMEEQLAQKKQEMQQCQQALRTMGSTDSLERYAREHYYMHTADEEVYLVAE
jgi:cell division protein FtsB